MSLFRMAATVVAAVTIASLAGAGVADATQYNDLRRGGSLAAGDYLGASPLYVPYPEWDQLIMQADGNLVEYNFRSTDSGTVQTVCWASNTYNHPGNVATYQQDGNFVVYNVAGHPMWASNTAGKPGTTVNLSDNGGVLWVGTTKVGPPCVTE